MKKLLYVFMIIFSSLYSYEYELSVCAIFHDEDRFLKDWIDFHLKVGVQHFYLYNHQSKDNFENVLKPYIEKGIVECKNWDYSYENVEKWNSIQCNSYKDALDMSRHNSKWVAFIDTDEYIYSPIKQNLITVLKEYEDFGAVSVNWVIYGTSRIYQISPNVPMIYQLVCRAPFEYNKTNTVKSIIQPQKASHFINPHYPVLLDGYAQVTENNQVFHGPFSPSLSVNKLRINHYWSRDEKFFYEEKVRRGKLWTNKEIKVTEEMSSIIDIDILLR